MAVDTTPSMPDPHSIYQEWLDRTSAALMSGNVEGFTSGIALPFIMRTATAETVLEDLEDLEDDVTNVMRALQSQQVTDYIRLMKQARYVDEDTIEGWHTTYVLRNATSVTPNYSNRMILRRIGAEWKVSEADHELSGTRFPMTLLKSSPGSFSQKWAAAKADISATQARAEPIYQVFLTSLTKSVNEANFDDWAAHYTYPHDIHYDATDHTAHTPGDVHVFFEIMQEQMQAVPDTRMERSVLYAEFLSDDRVVGYHDTFMTRDGKTVFGPVKCRMVLTQKDGRWACSSVTNSLSQENLGEVEFRLSTTLPTMRAIQERMRK